MHEITPAHKPHSSTLRGPITSKSMYQKVLSGNPLKEALTAAIGILIAGMLFTWFQYQGEKSEIQSAAKSEFRRTTTSGFAALDKISYLNMINQGTISKRTYQELLQPLTSIHNESPHLEYIYTIQRYGSDYYVVLDTQADPNIQEKTYKVKPPEKVENVPPELMEAYRLGKQSVADLGLRSKKPESITIFTPLPAKNGEVAGVLVTEYDPDNAYLAISQSGGKWQGNFIPWAIFAALLGFTIYNTRSSSKILANTLGKEEEKLLQMTSTVPGVVYLFRMTSHGERGFLYISQGVETLYGITPEEALANWKDIKDFVPTQGHKQAYQSFEFATEHMQPWLHRYQINHPTQGEKWVQNHAQPTREHDGSILWNGVLTDITQQVLSSRIREKGDSIFQLISQGEPLGTVLQAVALYIQSEISNCRVAFYLPKRRSGQEKLVLTASASLPPNFQEAMEEFQTGTNHASAAVAAITNQEISTPDISTNKYWEGVRTTALSNNIRACWSYPIRNSEGILLGVLDIYYQRVCDPNPLTRAQTSTLAKSGYPLHQFMESAIQIAQTAIERDLAQTNLKANEERYRTLFESCPAGICETQPKESRPPSHVPSKDDPFPHQEPPTGKNPDILTYVNPAFAQLLESEDPKEFKGKTLEEILELPREATLEDTQTGAHSREYQITTPTGTHKTLLCESASISRSDGKITTIHFFTDITQRRKSEEQLQESKRIAEAANKAKSEFLAMMSHEIRTPMNGVLGYTEMLKKTPLEGKQKKYVDIIQSSGKNLLTIINDILDFSKIEAGKMELDNTPFNLHETIEHAVALLSANAKAKGLELTSIIDEKTPIYVQGDENRIKQIIFNLAGNAIKFTEKGSVTLEMYPSLREKKTGEHTLYIDIKDTGIGIPKDKQKRLFQPFSQAESSTTRKFGGTGLGLAISRRLTQLMGGDITLKSEENKGSTFSIKVFLKESTQEEYEAAKQEESHQKTGEDKHLPSLNILIAEDDTTNRELLQDIFEEEEHTVTFAKNGKEVLEILRETSPHKDYHKAFDCILMDMQMPEMDGVEATYTIREEENQSDRIPIVALTANVLEVDRKRCSNSGMNGFLNKPIKIPELFKTLEEFQEKKKEQEPQKEDITPSTEAPKPPEKSGPNAPEEIPLPETPPSGLPQEEEDTYSAIDIEAVEELFQRGNGRLLQRMLEAYKTDNHNRLQKLEEIASAMENGDETFEAKSPTESWEDYVHAIKGSSANIGLEQAYILSSKMQSLPPQNYQQAYQEAKELREAINLGIEQIEIFITTHQSDKSTHE